MKENKELHEKLIQSTIHIDRLHNYEKNNQKLRDKLHILNCKVFKLENKVTILNKLVKTLDKILHSFINWVCNKFSLSEENTIKEFEQDTNISFDINKQVIYEEHNINYDLELLYNNDELNTKIITYVFSSHYLNYYIKYNKINLIVFSKAL